VAALLGHTGHTITNGVMGVSVCHIFFSFFFDKKMAKKNKALEAKSGNEPRALKRKKQSAPLATGSWSNFIKSYLVGSHILSWLVIIPPS
jgi:hypothetical protein